MRAKAGEVVAAEEVATGTSLILSHARQQRLGLARNWRVTSGERVRRDKVKRESEGFHSTWVEQLTPTVLGMVIRVLTLAAVEVAETVAKLAAVDAVETAVEVTVAKEVARATSLERCLYRHWNLGLSRTSRVISSQSAQ